MATIDTVIKTPKEATELGLALAKVVIEVKKALADGAGADDLAKMVALVASPEVIAGVQGLDQMGAEYAADKTAFVAAFMVAALKLAEDLKAPVV